MDTSFVIEHVRRGYGLTTAARALLGFRDERAQLVAALQAAADGAAATLTGLAARARENAVAATAAIGDHDLSRALWEERDRLFGEQQRWEVFLARYKAALDEALAPAATPADHIADHPDEVVV